MENNFQKNHDLKRNRRIVWQHHIMFCFSYKYVPKLANACALKREKQRTIILLFVMPLNILAVNFVADTSKHDNSTEFPYIINFFFFW